MKILIVSQHFYPKNFQINNIVEDLVKSGHEVTVITGICDNNGMVSENYKNGKNRNENIYGAQIIRCSEAPKKKSAVGLALNYISFLFSANRALKKNRDAYDIVFVYQLSPVLMALPALKYAKKHKLPLFVYVCDIWPESVKNYIKNEKHPIFRWAKRVSKKVYTAADKIGIQSKSFGDYLTKIHGILKEKMVHIPGFSNDSYLNEDFSNENGVTDFVFLGNLGIAQNLFSIVEAVDIIRDTENFRLHIVGTGALEEKLINTVKDKKLEDKIVFYGHRPVEEMPNFYRLADACLVSLNTGNYIQQTMPTKIQGYMAAGKPVIAMLDGSGREAIEESGCGVCVSATDTAGFAAAMKDFILHPEKYEKCGELGRKYFRKNYMFDDIMFKFEEEFNGLIKR